MVNVRRETNSSMAHHCFKLPGCGTRFWNQSWVQISAPGCTLGKPGSFYNFRSIICKVDTTMMCTLLPQRTEMKKHL